MTLLVLDASALVAVLTDGEGAAAAVAGTLAGSALAAPDLQPFEVANVLRRLELGGYRTPDTAALAHGDLLDLAVQLWPYASLAAQAWQLRGSLTLNDASYVALAGQLEVPAGDPRPAVGPRYVHVRGPHALRGLRPVPAVHRL